MGDRGHTVVPVTESTTEWDEILISKGITERDEVLRNKGLDPDAIRLEKAVRQAREDEVERLQNLTLEETLDAKTLDEIKVLEEEDEFDDDDDEAFLKEYREQRLAQMKEAASKDKYGEVRGITKGDWLVEVNEASQDCWVVVHLFVDSMEACGVMERCSEALAKKFKAVKFVKIRSKHAIENWPDENCPALFCYSGGEMKKQLITCAALGGVGMTPADLEWYLASQGVVETDMVENPRRVRAAKARKATKAKGSRYSDDEGDDDDDHDDEEDEDDEGRR